MAQNYELFRNEMQEPMKTLKTATALADNCSKASIKAIDAGDFKALDAKLKTLRSTLQTLTEALDTVENKRNTFDVATYFSEGDFAEQLVACCKEANVDVQIEGNNYRMFPSKVTIDAKSATITLDRKKYVGVRPKILVNKIKDNQEKLRKANFNAKTFGKEIAAAYDTLIAKSGKEPETALSLQTIYQQMTPMSFARKEYDYQAFSFDVMRMETQSNKILEDGRILEFGSSRKNKQPVRYIDDYGTEHFFYTLTIKTFKL